MDLLDTMQVSAAGMKAQSDRLKVVSQNLANAESIGLRKGEQPYRRQTISFKEEVDRATGIKTVQTSGIGVDNSEFEKRFEPSNPMADDEGYVLYPNVNPIIEMMDMREARRGYEANLNVIEASKTMVNQTLGLLR